jgi:hypothetical protein
MMEKSIASFVIASASEAIRRLVSQAGFPLSRE